MAEYSHFAKAGNSPIIHRQRPIETKPSLFTLNDSSGPSAPQAYTFRDNRYHAPGSMDREPQPYYLGHPSPQASHGAMISPQLGRRSYPPAGQLGYPVPSYPEWSPPLLREPSRRGVRSPDPCGSPEYILERNSHRAADNTRGSPQYISQRQTANRDEFDGPHQILPSSARNLPVREDELPQLPTNLDAAEQDRVLHQVNDHLSQCAYDFFAKYAFPIPLEQDKRRVQVPSDREWNEWVHLLKRLATRRRIPRHALHNGQIKQLITVLENSLEMRHAAKHNSRPIKDDRNVLQLISAGTQVAKILKDPTAMSFFDRLYVDTERLILERRRRVRFVEA